jgi:hypothetical protein
MHYRYDNPALNFQGLPALRGLKGYTKNGAPTITAQWGDTIVWDIPGHSPGTVFLRQTVNGVLGYNGTISVPTAPITLGPGQPTGIWYNTVYDKDPAQGGVVIETDTLTILASSTSSKPGQVPVGSTGGLTCPTGLYPYAAYIDPNGNYMGPGCQASPTVPGQLGSPTITPGTPPTTVVALAPNTPGVLPKGQGNVSNIPSGTIYRFILAMGGGYATGANYNGCSQANSNNCDPQFFPTLSAAIQYALGRGEIPYKVFTTQDPWNIINGTLAINPCQIYNHDGSLPTNCGGGIGLGELVIVGLIGFFVLRRAL